MLEKVPLLAPLRVKRNLNLQSNTCGFVIHLPPLKTPQNPLKTSFKYVYGSGFVFVFLSAFGSSVQEESEVVTLFLTSTSFSFYLMLL